MTAPRPAPGPVPVAWVDLSEATGRRGRVAMRACAAPALFLADPSGHVGPGLLTEVVDRAEAFGRSHPDGWCYVVDLYGTVLPDPRNGRTLRRIPRLPHVRAYLAVAPRAARSALRLGAALGRLPGVPHLGPEAAHATLADAVTDATNRLAR